MAPLRAALADRYVLERELGRGGMATVYLARDLKHDRRVALKVLRPELAHALGPERFLREIALTAQLQHPLILPLLDSGQADGTLYYVMPFVEGESLRDRLDREQQLPLEEALQIARDVAEALGHAHSRGVIHRDVKPENILLESGRAVVADFGIAKAVSEAGGAKLTETGLAIGTPAYMSPEQAEGTGRLDARTDLYSLGCVLYEMLAGHAPFQGTTAHELFARHALDPVPPLRSARGLVPEGVEAAIERALAKAPADRFATTHEFAQLLSSDAAHRARGRRSGIRLRGRAIGIAAVVAAATLTAGVWMLRQRSRGPTVDPNVIAVMPLRVIGPDSTVRYLREGVLDILYVKLQGSGLRVLDPRVVLNRLEDLVGKSADPTPEEALALARRLGAGRLLAGELVADPREMLLNVRLLQVPDGRLVAEHQASRRAGESELQVLDRVLGGVLAAAAGDRAERLSGLSDSLRAVQAYLAGMRFARRLQFDSAYFRFTRALEIDTAFAIAALRRAQIARATVNLEYIQRAMETAWVLKDRLGVRDRAILMSTVGPRWPSASTSVDFLAAAGEAIRLAPDDAGSWKDYGISLMDVGYSRGEPGWIERATAAFDSAHALDPADADVLELQLYLALWTGDTARVRRARQAYLQANPTGDGVDGMRWLSAVVLGDSAELGGLRGRFDQLDGLSVRFIVSRSILFTLPLDGVMELLQQRAARASDPDSRLWALSLAGDLALVQGRVAQAVAEADSPPALPRPPGWYREGRRSIVQQALIDPGYTEAGAAAATWLRGVAETAKAPDYLCWSTIWRVQHGDTLDARAAIERIRALTRGRDNLPGARVSRFDMCPTLLEAMLEQAPPQPASSAALDRLDRLTRDAGGGWNALPINIAGFMIAQGRVRQGDLRAARAALARRPMMNNAPHVVTFPASFREEGRIAALMGDTAGAIEAYGRYLNLRTHPDPGPMAEEVRTVKEHLAQLVGERRGAPRR